MDYLKHKSETQLVLLYSLVSIVLFSLLYIGIFNNYAFADAYEFLWSAHSSNHFIDVFVQGGRPLYGEINKFIFGNFANEISDLKWIRLISLLSCVILTIQTFRFLIKSKYEIYESFIFSLLILTIPSFSIYMGWSVTYEIPIALNCSFLAGVLFLNNNPKKANKTINYLFAVLLVVVSLSLYQSAGTGFLIPFLIIMIKDKNKTLKDFISLFVFFCVSFGIYFLVFKLSLYLYELEPLSRSGIDLFNLPKKFAMFYFKELKTLLAGSTFLIQSTFFCF